MHTMASPKVQLCLFFVHSLNPPQHYQHKVILFTVRIIMNVPPEEASNLFFQQASTIMPVSVLDFDADSSGCTFPAPDYIPQQVSNCPGDFPASSRAPLIPISSVLIPVANEVVGGVDVDSVISTTEYNVPSEFGAYTCIPSSDRVLPAGSLQSAEIQPGISMGTQRPLLYSMDPAPLSTPVVSFVDSTELNDQYTTVSASVSFVDTEAVVNMSVAPARVRKCGRPRKNPVSVDSELTKTAIIPNKTTEVPPYNPSHFWCPLCEVAYTVSMCPIHPITIEVDRLVPTYARLTLPAGLEIDDRSETVRVLCTRRWPACTRFGPVVAPLVTEAQLQSNPDWQVRA